VIVTISVRREGGGDDQSITQSRTFGSMQGHATAEELHIAAARAADMVASMAHEKGWFS